MATTWNPNITINLYDNAQGVQRTDFSTLGYSTTGATFPETYRDYENPQAVADDSFLSVATKASLGTFFSQKRHQKKITVVKLSAYTAYAVELAAAAEDMSAVPYMWVTEDRTDDNAQAFVDWTTTNEKFCYVQSSTATVASGTGIFDTFYSASEPRVLPLYHHSDTQPLDLGIGTFYGADSPENTSTAVAYRTIIGMTANTSALGATEKAALVADNVSFYLPFYGVNIIFPGKMSDGGFADELVIKDWFKAGVGEGIAQLLLDAAAVGSKIPFTPTGLKRLEGPIKVMASKGYRLGHFDRDSLVISSKDFSDYTVADIRNRAAEISATITLAGAVGTVTVNVGVVYQQ